MLNKEELLNAIIFYLEHHYEQTKPDDTGLIAQSLNRMKKKETPEQDDLIIWRDWADTLKPFEGRSFLSEREAFDSMTLFLDGYYKRTASDDIGSVLSDLLCANMVRQLIRLLGMIGKIA